MYTFVIIFEHDRGAPADTCSIYHLIDLKSRALVSSPVSVKPENKPF